MSRIVSNSLSTDGTYTIVYEDEFGERLTMEGLPAGAVQELQNSWVNEGKATVAGLPPITTLPAPQAPAQPQAVPQEVPAAAVPPVAPVAPTGPRYVDNPNAGRSAALRMGQALGSSQSGPMGTSAQFDQEQAGLQSSLQNAKSQTTERQKDLENTAGQQFVLQEKVTDWEKQKAEAEFNILAARNKAVGSFVEKEAAIHKEADEALERQQKDIDGNVKKLATMSVNPENFWATRTTGATIGLSIAAALGAFASHVGGGQNFAQNIIDKAIDRDMLAQRAAIDDLRGTISMQDSALGRTASVYASKEGRIAAMRAAAYQTAANQLEEMTARMSPEMKALQAEDMKLQLQAKLEESKFQLAQENIKLDTQLRSVKIDVLKTRLAESNASSAAVADALKNNIDMSIPNVEWQEDAHFDEKDRPALKELKDTAGIMEGLETTLTGVRKDFELMAELGEDGLWDQVRGKKVPSALQTKINTKLSFLMSEYKDLFKWGALDAGVDTLFANMLGKPTDVLRNFEASFHQAHDTTIDTWNGKLKAHKARSTIEKWDTTPSLKPLGVRNE
jgi:CRISPR/Cas system CMR-associated protein Cmr5 small subunit